MMHLASKGIIEEQGFSDRYLHSEDSGDKERRSSGSNLKNSLSQHNAQDLEPFLEPNLKNESLFFFTFSFVSEPEKLPSSLS